VKAVDRMIAQRAPKVIALGLDSADPRLLLEWAASGKLPNLAALLERGVCGAISTPDGLGDDGVWPSFATCLPPGEHGRWFYRGTKPGSYEQHRFRPQDFNHYPFWHSIDAAGKRAVVIDVPKSPQIDMVRGVAVHDWRVHGIDGPPRSYPPDVARTLVERFGSDAIDRPEDAVYLCNAWPLGSDLKDVLLDSLQQSIADKRVVLDEFMGESPDLLLAVFKEAHCAGHVCWPPGPELARVYKALDQVLGRLVARAGPDATVIVFSDLGMADNFHGNRLLDSVLRRLERRLSSAARFAVTSLDIFYHRACNRLGSPPVSSRHRRRLAYQLEHNEIAGAVRINLKGREPCGRVAPGAELEELYAFLEKELLALTNTTTGKPAVERVLRRDAEPGAAAGQYLPDMLVVWCRDAPISSVYSPTVGVVKAHAHEDRPGNHVPGGLYVAAGPGIEPGAGPAADITDLGVTMAAILGVEVPGVTGRSIDVLCS